MDVEQKANIISTILNRTFALFLGDQFRGVVDRFVRRNYAKGMLAEEVKLKLQTNAVPDEEKLSLITENVQSEVKGVMDELNRKLQETVREGIINNESPTDIKKRVKLLMNPTDKLKHEFASGRKMNWRERIDLITRTESNRAQNQGHLDTARQSGLQLKKYLSIHEDDRLCPICKKAGDKYDKEHPISIDDEFIVTVSGKTYRFQAPPIHPRCRDRIMFRVEDGNTSGIEQKHKYIKREGTSGNYRYWYKDPKTGRVYRGDKPKEEVYAAESDDVVKVKDFFDKEMGFEEFFSSRSTEPWSKLKKYTNMKGDGTDYYKDSVRLTLAMLDAKGTVIAERIKAMKTVFLKDTPQDVINASNNAAMFLGMMSIGGPYSSTPEDRKKVIDKLREILNNDVRQINKALKYMGIKERIKKEGMRAKAQEKTKDEVTKSLKEVTYKDISYQISPTYIKNSKSFKNDAEFNKTFKEVIDNLPPKAKEIINSGKTKVHFITRPEAKKITGARLSSNSLGYYVRDTNQVYIFPEKVGIQTYDLDPRTLRHLGYDTEVINKLIKDEGSASWRRTVTHELAHAVAFNEEGMSQKQTQYDKEIFSKFSTEERRAKSDVVGASNYITHYARSSPSEDFAETFAYYTTNKKEVDKLLDLKVHESKEVMSKLLKTKFKWMRDNLWQ